jgi:hypothetical protein
VTVLSKTCGRDENPDAAPDGSAAIQAPNGCAACAPAASTAAATVGSAAHSFSQLTVDVWENATARPGVYPPRPPATGEENPFNAAVPAGVRSRGFPDFVELITGRQLVTKTEPGGSKKGD